MRRAIRLVVHQLVTQTPCREQRLSERETQLTQNEEADSLRDLTSLDEDKGVAGQSTQNDEGDSLQNLPSLDQVGDRSKRGRVVRRKSMFFTEETLQSPAAGVFLFVLLSVRQQKMCPFFVQQNKNGGIPSLTATPFLDQEEHSGRKQSIFVLVYQKLLTRLFSAAQQERGRRASLILAPSLDGASPTAHARPELAAAAQRRRGPVSLHNEATPKIQRFFPSPPPKWFVEDRMVRLYLYSSLDGGQVAPCSL